MSVVHITDANGTQFWTLNNELHRRDGPAVIYTDGVQYWYINGKRHRENEPAIILKDGTQYWFIMDKLHRDNGPAIIYASGSQEWYINGKLCREQRNGEPMPVILEKNRASFDGYKFLSITTEEYEKYKYNITGKHTKASLREN